MIVERWILDLLLDIKRIPNYDRTPAVNDWDLQTAIDYIKKKTEEQENGKR